MYDKGMEDRAHFSSIEAGNSSTKMLVQGRKSESRSRMCRGMSETSKGAMGPRDGTFRTQTGQLYPLEQTINAIVNVCNTFSFEIMFYYLCSSQCTQSFFKVSVSLYHA